MLAERLEKIPELLRDAVERYRVPGASLAVLCEGESFEAAAGVVNLRTGVEATPDAVFQIGSVTKVLTTSLVMQLVDEGRVELDAPVRTVLPELQLGDEEAARAVTLRHLLTHTSGIDGDFFQDTGRGDDCVERYVLACSALGQLHAPGQGFSYCNAGFVIAGRIVEKLRGTTWDAALRRHLLDPIGASTLHTLPEQALYHRAAVGHMRDPETEQWQPAAAPFLVRSNGPAGATPFGATHDLLCLARLHLSGGLGADGARVLSEASVAAMQEPQAEVPSFLAAAHWGLGWMLFDWDGSRLIGHDGATLGQSAFFRVVPGRGIAVSLLANGGNTAALYRRIYAAILGELAGITLPPLPEAGDVEIEPARYVGSYERLAARTTVEDRKGTLWVTTIERRPLLESGAEPEAMELTPVNDRLFFFTAPGTRFKTYLAFLDFDARGRAQKLHAGLRTMPRVG